MSDKNVPPKNVVDEHAEYLKNGWTLAFHEICRECQQYPYKINEARKPQNKPLNRYRDVNPYDHSRVVLSRGKTDYINANFLEVKKAKRKYILTQGPLAQTVSHFWLMVWEQNSQAIIMLNRIIEKNEIKCHWYWPEDSGSEKRMEFPDVNISVEQVSESDHNYFCIRKFKVCETSTGETRQVLQYHYVTWPDFGVPVRASLFLEFLACVRQDGMVDTEAHPPVVHCSAGIGRSGTFCLIDSALVIYEQEGLDNLNIKNMILDMRKYRMGLIQTPDQLRFSYETILEGIKRHLNPGIDTDEEQEETEPAKSEELPPPPPPPRGESLQTKAPVRPLPALPPAPHDVSEAGDGSSSEGTVSDDAPSVDEEDELFESESEERGLSSEGVVRRRRTKELEKRVTAMRRKARAADRWHSFKRSLYKPITITCGIILCGIIGYAIVSQRF